MTPTEMLPLGEERVQTLLKAVVVGARVDDPASRGGGEQSSAFADAGALAPPYDPEAMVRSRILSLVDYLNRIQAK